MAHAQKNKCPISIRTHCTRHAHASATSAATQLCVLFLSGCFNCLFSAKECTNLKRLDRHHCNLRRAKLEVKRRALHSCNSQLTSTNKTWRSPQRRARHPPRFAKQSLRGPSRKRDVEGTTSGSWKCRPRLLSAEWRLALAMAETR